MQAIKTIKTLTFHKLASVSNLIYCCEFNVTQGCQLHLMHCKILNKIQRMHNVYCFLNNNLVACTLIDQSPTPIK